MMYSNLMKQMLMASINELSKTPENYAVHPQKDFTRKHVGTRQSSRLLYRPVYKEVFSPPGVTDEPQNVFHDALLNYQKHYLLF